MTDFIQKFINFLHANGVTPSNNSDIIADDKKNRFHILGDKPLSKNGVYQLKTEANFAVGWAMSYKINEVYKFTDKNFRTLTAEEKAEFAKKIDAERKRKQREREIDAQKAQEKAAAIWKLAAKEGESEYLKRKNCDVNGARFYKGLVTIPAYKDGKISTLQFISDAGDKRFVENGSLEGGYFPIATSVESKEILLLCEGFSTGDSIRKATNLPVICCFNAGNLKPVAQAMRIKYPNAQIVFCADNDEFTEINGVLTNIGIIKAQQAAAAIGGATVIFPEFPNNNPDKFSDFNDAYIALGVEYVKNRIEAVINKNEASSMGGGLPNLVVQPASDNPAHQIANMPIAAEDNWREQLVYDDKGNLAKNNVKNGALFLLNHETLKKAFVYDEFHMEVMTQRDITGGNSKFEVHPLNDSDIMQMVLFFERYGLLKDERKISALINYIARCNPINPARDYFDSLKWDGVERLESWLVDAFGAPEPQEYLGAIGKKWMTAAVKRVYQPACKFDHMLMLEGLQGAGKSSALELLAAFGEKIERPYLEQPEKSYYTDALTFDAMGDKDCMLLTAGAIIVVLEELVGKSKRNDDDIKRWITLRSDKGRLPYARSVTEMKRQFVLAGTTNNSDYLRDSTGNRRYWCLNVTKVDKKYINDSREQLWAEAVMWHKQGIYLGLEGNELKLAEIEQKKRLEEDVWEKAVEDALLEFYGRKFETQELLTRMNLPLKDQDARAALRVKNILKNLGYNNAPVWMDGKTQRRWVKE